MRTGRYWIRTSDFHRVSAGLTATPTIPARDSQTPTVAVKRPRLLDLFCGAGGCAVGYDRAGFDVTGVDNKPQPRFPFTFHQADALEYLAAHGSEFDAIHASPPCQAYTVSKTRAKQRKVHPDLVGPCRDLLEQAGKRWVIENVPGAPLRFCALLCGSQFGLGATCEDGVRRPLRRHRMFETNWLLLSPGCQCGKVEKIGVYGNGGGWANRFDPDRAGYKGCVSESREALGIDWMTIAELSQSIPPAYTQFIGNQLRVFFRLTGHPQLGSRTDRVQVLGTEGDVIAFRDARRRVAELSRDQLQGCPVGDGCRGHAVPDAVQAGPAGVDPVPLAQAAEVVSEGALVPCGAAGVDEDRLMCVCGHSKAMHYTSGCAGWDCPCPRYVPKQPDSITDQGNHLRLAGEPPALVPLNDPHASVKVHVGPGGLAQLRQPAARQSQEPQGRFELLAGNPADRLKNIVGQFGPAFGLGVADRLERVAVDPLGLGRPLEAGADGVALLPLGGRAFPAGVRLDPIAQVEGFSLCDGHLAQVAGEQAQGELTFTTRGGTVDADRQSVAEVGGDHVLDQQPTFTRSRLLFGAEQADCGNGTAPSTACGRRLRARRRCVAAAGPFPTSGVVSPIRSDNRISVTSESPSPRDVKRGIPGESFPAHAKYQTLFLEGPMFDVPASPPQQAEDCRPAANPFGPRPELLRETFDITETDGTKLVGRLYGTLHRTSGRRITVHDQAGRLLYDGDDSYDFGNATNGLDLWLADRERFRRPDVRQDQPGDPTDALCVG